MTQQILVYLIVTAAVVYAIRHIRRVIRRGADPCNGCAGCAGRSEAERNKQQCPKKEEIACDCNGPCNNRPKDKKI